MGPPDDTKVYDTPLNRFWFGSDGILYSISKREGRTIGNFEKLFELFARLSENGKKKLFILADITEVESQPKKLREFVTKEMSRYVMALAMISSSATGMASANIFEILSRTPCHIATFESREEAVRWLKQQMAQAPCSPDDVT